MEKINFKPLLAALALILLVLGWRVAGGKILPKKGNYFSQLGIKKEEVRVISLKTEGKEIEIKKENEVWKIKGKKAKEMVVNDLLAAIFPQREPELVAKTSSRHQQMGVDESQAIKIRINGDKEIWLGKNGNYLRFPQKDEVWLAKESWTSFTADFSFWADKTIVFVEKEKLKKLEIQKGQKTKTFEDLQKIPQEILDLLTPFNADEVVEDERPAGYGNEAKIVLNLEWEGGGEKLEFFPGGKNYLVKRNSDGQMFVVSTSRLTAMEKI